MGTKRGTGRGSFINSVIEGIDSFYAQVMQSLKPWAAAPPRLRDTTEIDTPPGTGDLVSSAHSSQDGTEHKPEPDAADADAEVAPVDDGPQPAPVG